MPLSKNQLEAIDRAVNTGAALSFEMSSELLAAYLNEKSQAENLRMQKSQETARADKLTWERDETLRIKGQLEREIEERVEMRTKMLVDQAEDWRGRFAFLQNDVSSLKLELANNTALISRMKKLLSEKMSPNFIARTLWKRRAKKVLEAAAHIDQTDE